LASGTDGGNGVYRYGVSSGFPSSTYNASNYWVDVIFTPTITNDIQPPTVAGNTPASGLTAVPTNTTVTVTFSEAVQASTISFILRDPSNNAIPAVVTSDAATNTATLTPTSALANGTTFTATVSGAQDSAGNAMTSPVSWSFTTVDAVTARDPFTIWGPSATPAATSQVTSSAELGLKFRSDVDGIIRGVRFHKDLANTGVHVANLWTRTGQKLATATFTNETASGWQQVLFSSPVAIKADTTYVVSYFAPAGRYSITVSGLVSRVDNPPLRALASGGVYIYNPSSAFPTTTYRSTNYWVDVVFDERTAPTIVSRSPAPAATGVSRAAKVKVTFSEAIDPATINTGTFILRQGANAVAATITYDAATSTATLSPVSSLQAGTAYTVLVKGGDTGVKDLIGNPLAADAPWTFTTA
jgi:methionine-rich copper-binding protein CopC